MDSFSSGEDNEDTNHPPDISHIKCNGFLPQESANTSLLDTSSLSHLRSNCLMGIHCPQGQGLQFRSRISPSPKPSKRRVNSRRRKRHQNQHSIEEETTSESIFELNQSSRLSENSDSLLSRENVKHSSSNTSEGRNLESIKEVTNIRDFSDITSERTSTPISKNRNKALKNTEELINTSNKSISNSQYSEASSSFVHSFIPATAFFASNYSRGDPGSDYFSGSDTPTKLQESTRRLTLRKPYNSYIAYSSDEELEDWWEQPKTDYTYSASLTYRECVTPERQIPSPNMSRRAVRGSKTPHMKSPPFKGRSLRSLALRSGEVPRGSYSNFSDESADELDASPIVQELPKPPSSSKVHGSHSSTFLSKRVLSHGFDDVSDVEDDLLHTSTPLGNAAKPMMVRKGVTSLLSGPNYHTKSDFQSQSHLYDYGQSYSGASLNGRHSANASQLLKRNTMKEWMTRILETIKSWFFYLIIFITLVYTALAKAMSKTYNYFRNYSHLSSLPKSNESLETRSLPVRAWSYTKTIITIVTTTICTTTTTTATTIYAPLYKTGSFAIRQVRKLPTAYQERRKQNPWLWSWILPLLLLLLTLFFFGVIWKRGDHIPSSSGEESSTNSRHKSSEVANFLSTISSFGVWLFSALHDLLHNLYSVLYSVVGTSYSRVVNVLGLLPNSESLNIVISKTSSTIRNVTDSVVHTVSSSYETVFEALKKGPDALYWVLSSSGAFALYCLNTLWTGFVITINFILSYFGLVVSWFYTIASKTYSTLPSVSSKDLPSENIGAPKHVDESSEALLAAALHSEHFHTMLSSAVEGNFKQRSLTKEQIELAIKENVEKEMNLLKEALSSSSNDDANFRALVQSLKEKTDQLSKKLEEMNLSHTGVEGTNAELNRAIVDISSYIDKLSNRLDKLENDHLQLSAQMKNCCNKSVTIEDVKRHISLLFKDLLPSDVVEGESPSLDPIRFGSWLKTYFVAKDELERSLNNVTVVFQDLLLNETMSNKKLHSETSNQSMKHIMETVLQKLREEMHQETANMHNNMAGINRASSEAVAQIKKVAADGQNTLLEERELLQKEIQDASLDIKKTAEKNITSVVEQILLGSFGKDISAAIANEVKEQIRTDLAKDAEKGQNSPEVQTAEAIKNVLPKVVADYITTNTTVLQRLIQNNHHNHGSEGSFTGGILSSPQRVGETLSSQHIPLFPNSVLNESTVRKIVKEALLKYDADKTGLVDHALESAGGSVVSTKCTESYEAHQAEWTIMGYPVFWISLNDPRSVIQPGRMPGECWAFKGSEGALVIRLAGPVQMTGFTLEHIPESLNPSGKIDSAPKDFSVYGIEQIDKDRTLIGQFQYVSGGDPLQYFQAGNRSEVFYPFVELNIHSNHGNLHYTCIYRFRVHGIRKDIAVIST